MNVLLDIVSWVALLIGGGLVLVGGLGMVRLPDFFTRLHAASLTDTLGAGLVLVGLALQVAPGITTLKLAMVLVLLLVTGPVATHALAKAALHGSLRPWGVGEEVRLAPEEDES